MDVDALLASTDIEEALSEAYVHAIAAGAGYVVSRKNFDRDGVDITLEAGDAMRPKIDAQLKATTNLPPPVEGVHRFPCLRRNYDLLRIETQTPRILVVLDLPTEQEEWLTVSPEQLVLKRCAYWTSLRGFPETKNSTSVTVDVPVANRFDVSGLKALMDQSRSGKIG